MDLEVFPERLAIIGGGYIGLEFASMYSSFGSEVTVLQDGDVFLPREDEDMAAVIDEESKKILGAMLLCEESFEAINIIKLAMDLNVDYTVLRDQIFTHPTMSEAFNDLFQ